MSFTNENKKTETNAGVVVGILVIFVSLLVVPFSDKGFTGILIGVCLLFVSLVFSAASKKTSMWLRMQIVKNPHLSEMDVEHYIAEYCEYKKLSAEETAKTMAILLQERTEYQSSVAGTKYAPNLPSEAPKTALMHEYSVPLNDSLSVQVKTIDSTERCEQESIPDIADLAFQKVIKNQPKPEVSENHYTIFYSDFKGNKTRREIDFKNFFYDGKLYIMAWCYLRNALRHFDICRIERLFDYTGREIPNPERYFLQMYENSDECKIKSYFEIHSDELKVLVFLARADGQMRKNEREVIVEYIQQTMPQISGDALDSRIKACSCEFSEFQKLIKILAKKSPEEKQLLIDSAKKIYGLKKNPDAMETGIFQKIQDMGK